MANTRTLPALSRRTFVVGASIAPAFLLAGRHIWADAPEGLASSPLVYLTPLKSNGEESRCKAEIWFAYDGSDIFVVTEPDRWRARAVDQGLTRARIWVGDFGVWTRSDGAFRQAPELMATGSIETAADIHAKILGIMGEKYADTGWSRFGEPFRTGLADGSRVMIRYAFDG